MSAAEEIGRLVNRILALAPEAGLYVSIKVEPAKRDSDRLPKGHDRGHGAPASQSGDSEAGASPKSSQLGQCGEVR